MWWFAHVYLEYEDLLDEDYALLEENLGVKMDRVRKGSFGVVF